MRAPKGVSSTVAGSGSHRTLGDGLEGASKLLSSSVARNLWLKCASFSGATEINRQDSGEERMKH